MATRNNDDDEGFGPFSLLLYVVLVAVALGLVQAISEPEKTGRQIGGFFGGIVRTYHDTVGGNPTPPGE